MNRKFTIALSMILLASAGIATSASAQEKTRAEVRADLVRVEQAGYNPSRSDDADYPADIQAAEARVAAQDHAQLGNDAVGGMPLTGTTSSGAPKHAATQSSCVGPASFCDVFFGS